MLEGIISAIESVSIPDIKGELYIFGSILHSGDPSDVDLLLIVNESIVNTKIAYKLADPLIASLQKTTARPIDLTILTIAENAKSEFSKLIGAKFIRQF